MRRQQWEPEQWETVSATFLWEPAERSLFPVRNFGVDQHNALHAFAHADGHYHLMGCMLSAASCNKWWMDEIIGTKDYAKEQEAD